MESAKTNNPKVIAKLRRLRNVSAGLWELAADTAAEEQRESVELMAEGCLDSYKSAIDAIIAGDKLGALDYLGAARTLEAEGGDSAQADAAIELVEALS